MTGSFRNKGRAWSLWVASSVCLVCAAWLYFIISPEQKRVPAPPAVVISECREVGPGIRRIGSGYAVQFDVPMKEFTMGEGCTDAAPTACGIDLGPKNRKALMEISLLRPLRMSRIDALEVFSKQVEKRGILDAHGRTVGQDAWGCWSTGECWRKIKFPGGIVAEYGLVNESDARLFDAVISSACFSSRAGP